METNLTCCRGSPISFSPFSFLQVQHFYSLQLGSLEGFASPRISTLIHGFAMVTDQDIERQFISYIYQQRSVSPLDLQFVDASLLK
jgi:hypothetical protein